MIRSLLPETAEGGGGRTIQDGDLVVVYETHDQMKAVWVHAGKSTQNRFGLFLHNDWIGKPFGIKVVASKRGGSGMGFVHLLEPTPELWTKILSHRTQILYMPDISMIVASLNLSPGCIVLESGTGSGSLTHSLARAVAPTGHVYSFEFHEGRAQAAREEFSKNKIDSVVTVQVRDIQGQGFPDDFKGSADAVFLDLPSPWLAIPSVALVLRPDGALCSFSPCIEQVQRCCSTMRQLKFTDLRTVEVLLRNHDITSAWRDNRGRGNFAARSHEFKRKREWRSDEINAPSVQNEPAGMADQIEEQVIVRPRAEARGHTGYLTFARLWV